MAEHERRQDDISLKEYLGEFKTDIKEEIGKVNSKVDQVVSTVGELAILIAGQYVKKEDFDEHVKDDEKAHSNIFVWCISIAGVATAVLGTIIAIK